HVHAGAAQLFGGVEAGESGTPDHHIVLDRWAVVGGIGVFRRCVRHGSSSLGRLSGDRQSVSVLTSGVLAQPWASRLLAGGGRGDCPYAGRRRGFGWVGTCSTPGRITPAGKGGVAPEPVVLVESDFLVWGELAPGVNAGRVLDLVLCVLHEKVVAVETGSLQWHEALEHSEQAGRDGHEGGLVGVVVEVDGADLADLVPGAVKDERTVETFDRILVDYDGLRGGWVNHSPR